MLQLGKLSLRELKLLFLESPSKWPSQDLKPSLCHPPKPVFAPSPVPYASAMVTSGCDINEVRDSDLPTT